MNISVWLVTILLLLASTAMPVPQTAVPNPQQEGAAVQDVAAEASDYWLGTMPEVSIRLYNSAALSPLTTVSVSPSGKYIAAVDRSKLSKEDRFAAGIGNPMGRLPEALYLFSKHGTDYALLRTIPIDRETQPELSSILGGGGDIAWNRDETRCVISYKWGSASETMSYVSRYHSNLYLLDLADDSICRLTDNSEPAAHCVLPAWSGENTVRYLRMSIQGDFYNSLCEFDLETGKETKLADLFNAGGSICVVDAWQAVGDRIYYIVDAYAGGSGFYVSPIGGRISQARCLVDIASALRETNRHPYCRIFLDMDVSADGRWACLTVNDQRVLTRDYPAVDNPIKPQSDPAHAVSVKTGRPWVPCHNVFLYDLELNRFVDPFRDAALAPEKVIVTGACFAPDGKTLLCTVFGDGAPWSIAEETRTTFYQIGLSDGRYIANRVFETELASSLWFPEGIRWIADGILCIPTGNATAYPVQLLNLKGE